MTKFAELQQDSENCHHNDHSLLCDVILQGEIASSVKHQLIPRLIIYMLVMNFFASSWLNLQGNDTSDTRGHGIRTFDYT